MGGREAVRGLLGCSEGEIGGLSVLICQCAQQNLKANWAASICPGCFTNFTAVAVYNQYDVRGVWPKDPNDGGGNDRSRSPSPRGRGRGVRAVA